MNYEIVANGACYYEGKLAGVYDEELAREHNIRKTLPTVEYLKYVTAFSMHKLHGVKPVLRLAYMLFTILMYN